MLIKKALSVMALLAISACTLPTLPHSASAPITLPVPLKQKWKLVEFQSFTQKDLAQTMLDLRELPRAHATVGCNGMNFQAATAPENTWKVKGIAMTRMHCEEVAKLEMAFAKHIQAAQYYVLTPKYLILKTNNGEQMVFEPTP